MARTVRVYDREFQQFSRPAIHPRISEMLRDLPRGTLLDLPAGSGALSWRLFKEGFAVQACDLRPEHFEPTEIPCAQGDLGGRFPFDDHTFDYATFVEGPEHAENPAHAFREFARVLKPGGRLVVTIPNYGTLEKRLRMVLFGSFEKAVSQERLRTDFGGDPAMLHITPLAYAQLKFFLETCGFRIERLDRDRPKRKQWLLYPLAMLIRLLGRLGGRRTRRKYWLDEVNSSAILMGGNTLILLARLVGPAGPAGPP
ncbi:MAG TPA: class I SAM-dependent methyltransferase [Phycisphaerae bacterium]|nr:class I SAM-dependent methyltransferase [Phycisphaerae bacterium]